MKAHRFTAPLHVVLSWIGRVSACISYPCLAHGMFSPLAKRLQRNTAPVTIVASLHPIEFHHTYASQPSLILSDGVSLPTRHAAAVMIT